MNKFCVILAIASILSGYIFFSCRQQSPPPEKAITKALIEQTDSFATTCLALQSAIGSLSSDSSLPEARSASSAVPLTVSTGPFTISTTGPLQPLTHLQQLFLQARLAYKRIEWAAEYFDPATSRSVNGAPVPEVELSGQVLEPAGLQVVEGYLFPRYDTSQKNELLRQLRMLQTACERYKVRFTGVDILDWQVLDAARLEVYRIMTLGITGFDNPLSRNSMAESATALEGLRDILQSCLPLIAGGSSPNAHPSSGSNLRTASGSNANGSASSNDSTSSNGGTPSLHSPALHSPGHLSEIFDAAISFLWKNEDFNSFDRATFITGYCNPLSRELAAFEKQSGTPVIRYNRLLNQDAATLFDSNAFNVNAFVPDYSLFATKEKVALGKTLFTDPSLSADGARSCQSCHQPDKAFTDGLVKNAVLGSSRRLKRNTPTLINAALQPAQFYDLRVSTLEDQARNVVQNKEEMHGSMQLSAQRLWNDTMYRRLFLAAFPKKERTGIDTLEIMNALGSYIRSLVLLNSRFDLFMRGDRAALNASEIRGFNLFMGKAKCGTCHYMPLFNGSFPPRYVKIESEVIGVPQSASSHQIDDDPGRYGVVKNASYLHSFKTPTVRNASRTAPYMHNGVFATLEEVIDFYDKGGGTGAGVKIDNQTLPFDKLDLTTEEKSNLVSFIRSLDSR